MVAQRIADPEYFPVNSAHTADLIIMKKKRNLRRGWELLSPENSGFLRHPKI
ncbi:hypothetical protein BOA8489_02834 [Boseongicola aestuarii]|uniref:Uncharacterized protein n=1 Tax=Boseongicola aestuarii TaxID=1470561 RepID=A0A238J274_9RHOB|nr:hypothetical protein BOA8489_02834 [Boseongicola aestuarii]